MTRIWSTDPVLLLAAPESLFDSVHSELIIDSGPRNGIEIEGGRFLGRTWGSLN